MTHPIVRTTLYAAFLVILSVPTAAGQEFATVVVRSVKPPLEQPQTRGWVLRYGLTWEDYERIQKIDGVASLLPLRIFPQQISHQNRQCDARLVATTEDYTKFHSVALAAGQFIKDKEDQWEKGDEQRFRLVVVLGAKVAAELFPKGNAIDQTVVLNKEQYQVVGVLRIRPPRQHAANQPAEDYDRDVYIPIKTCKVRFGERVIIRQNGTRTAEEVQLHEILLQVRAPGQLKGVANTIRGLLDKLHQTKDYEVSLR